MSDVCYNIRKLRKVSLLKAKEDSSHKNKGRPERKRGVYHVKK